MNKSKRLSRAFFDRDPRIVGPELLGKVLTRTLPRATLRARIVELEVYLGVDDPAAHAFSGLTTRNAVLFGPPGHAYIYFIYGMYYCLNFSCMPPGQAGSLLIRALEPLDGLDHMAEARGLDPRKLKTEAGRKLLTSGPGRLCQAFSITRERDNDKDVTASNSDLQVVDDGFVAGAIKKTPRVGITKAMEAPLRYFLAGNAFVSGKEIKS